MILEEEKTRTLAKYIFSINIYNDSIFRVKPRKRKFETSN